MATVRLSEERQDAVRALLALDPLPGQRLPGRTTLAVITRVVPCDVVGVGVFEPSGVLACGVSLPAGPGPHRGAVPGPVPVGLFHQAEDPRQRPALVHRGMTDGLLLAFTDGTDRVVRLSLERRHRCFPEDEVGVLRMVAPSLRRLLREQAGPLLPAALTAQEHRVLQLVGTGMSNAEVAARMFVAPSTVRKHLEHAFRKLGVSNRLAAVQAFEGRACLPLQPAGTDPPPERG